MVSLYSIVLIVIDTIALMSGSLILLWTYKKTKYLPHIMLSIGLFFQWIASALKFITAFFPENYIVLSDLGTTSDVGIVELLWAIDNIFLIAGIIIIFASFIYIRTNRFHPILNFISFLGGALVFALVYPDFTTIVYIQEVNSWSASYSPFVMLFIFPLILFFLGSFIFPLAYKIRKSTDKKMRWQLGMQIVGFSFVLIWAFLAAFTSAGLVSLIRPIMFDIGWFIWSLTVLMDPFNIMVSNAKVDQLMITTSSGLPVYYYDSKMSSYDISPDLTASVMAGIEKVLEEIVREKSELNTVIFGDQVVGVVNHGILNAYVFGGRFDKTLETVLHFLLQKIQEEESLIIQINSDYINLTPEGGQLLSEMIEESLKSVLILQAPKS